MNGDSSMAYRLELDSIACIGCAACTKCAAIEMQQDMKAHAVQKAITDIDCIREMVEDCPVGAISLRRILTQESRS